MIGDAIASMLSYIKRYDARRGEKPGFFVDLVEKANIFQRNPVSLRIKSGCIRMITNRS